MQEQDQQSPATHPREAPMHSVRHLGILDSEIPLGGAGRHLSSAECRKLRARGVECDERYVVVRVAVDTPRLGHLYEPVYTPERLAGIGVMLG